MERRSSADGEGLRAMLGALTGHASRALASVARRLGAPTFATIASVPVSAAMLTRLETVTADQSLGDAASLFVTGRQPFLPVVKDGAPVGAVTKADVALGLRLVGPHANVAAAPSHEVVTVTPSDSLAVVLERLRATPDSVAVVVDDGEPVGLLTFERVVQYLERKRAA